MAWHPAHVLRQSTSEPRRKRTRNWSRLLSEEDYERVKAFFEEDLPTEKEQLAYLSHLVKISGWDDPEIDIYDDMK